MQNFQTRGDQNLYLKPKDRTSLTVVFLISEKKNDKKNI